jgi:uncharacterized protein YjbI with pentapeptide repeats
MCQPRIDQLLLSALARTVGSRSARPARVDSVSSGRRVWPTAGRGGRYSSTVPPRSATISAKAPAAPDLPADLVALAVEPEDLDSADWWQHDLSGADLTGADARDAEIGQCRFGRVRLPGVKLTRCALTDCAFDHADLANVTADGANLRRVAFTGCRGTGLTFLDSGLRDITFTDCRLDLTNWRSSKFTSVRFTECDLRRADFYGADLRGVHFDRCDLTAAQFSSAKLAGGRFAGCDLSGIGGVTSLAGATIAAGDLLALTELFAGALGITVERAATP